MEDTNKESPTFNTEPNRDASTTTVAAAQVKSKYDSDSPGTSVKGTQEQKKKSRKRKVPQSNKSKRKKKHVFKKPRLSYTVEEGEDMLLVISNVSKYYNEWKPKKKAGKGRKKSRKAKSAVSAVNRKTKALRRVKAKMTSGGEGTRAITVEPDGASVCQNLPVEVLVTIFQLVVNQEGAVPFLCRAARVCHLWNRAASNPALWRNVTVGYCWLEPGKAQHPKTEQRIKSTVSWLAENRFTLLREFALCHWKKHVDYVVQVLSQTCPHLTSLKLSYCSGVTDKAFESLGQGCQLLDTINVQYSELQVDGLVAFLEAFGDQMRKLYVTYGPKIDKLLSSLAKGCCPELKLLEINTKLDSRSCQLPICIQALQKACPKLQTFRMLNVTPTMKSSRSLPGPVSGFPHLEELCMATSAVSFMTDQHLHSVLHDSPKLRVLDLRGCTRISAAILSTLPCEDLECLYWGLYFSSNNMVTSKKGINQLTQKWSHSLKELDITSQPFSEDDLETAMANIAYGPKPEFFKSLNLSSTKVTINALRSVICHCPNLCYLNLSSCRYLPRGVKRVYRFQEEIQQLPEKLT